MEMTVWEICQSYKNAENRNNQIKILAELNLCSKREIIEVLSDNGICFKAKKDNRGAKPKPSRRAKNKPKRRERHEWTQEETNEVLKLYERGYAPYDISEKNRNKCKNYHS